MTAVKIDVHDTIDGELRETCWQLYFDAFEELNAYAVQRHLMYRSEFDEVMDDRRIQKYLALDDGGEPQGISTYTNDLTAMPLISPAYFERRWPEHYAQGRVWYCGFVATHTDGRATPAFARLVEAMYRHAAERDGIIALDFCGYNDEEHRMARVIQLMLHRVSGGVMRAHRMDTQSFWLYDCAPA